MVLERFIEQPVDYVIREDTTISGPATPENKRSHIPQKPLNIIANLSKEKLNENTFIEAIVVNISQISAWEVGSEQKLNPFSSTCT